MRKTILLLVLVLVLVACGDDPPPTQIVIVISPTPETGTPEVAASAAASLTHTAAPTVAPTTTPTSKPPAGSTPAATAASASEPAPLPTATPRPAIFPTDVTAEVQLAEQVFEHGRMFWIRHTLQIWVMEAAPDNPNSGDWYCYNDTFEEGEQEVDPDLIPPDGLFQPRRGFGKLWRNHPEIREALGWALTPEFELTSPYYYIAGGTVEGDQYFSGPGEHRLTTLYKERVSFFEGDIRGDCQGGTWQLTPND